MYGRLLLKLSEGVRSALESQQTVGLIPNELIYEVTISYFPLRGSSSLWIKLSWMKNSQLAQGC